jgi:dihydroorotate dehydrogenase electron transfer subunit
MRPWVADVRYNRRLNKLVYAIGLAPVDDNLCGERVSKAVPGQFYMLGLPGRLDPFLRRPFSHFRVVKHEGKNCLELIYEVKGKGTRALSGLSEGEAVSLMGPLGEGFRIADESERIVMVAGGVGVVPVFSLLACCTQSSLPDFVGANFEKKFIDFIWGVKTKDVFFGLHELEGISRSLGLKLNFHLCTEDGSYDHKGMATDVLKDVVKGWVGRSVQVIACGPLAMLKEIVNFTRDKTISCQFCMEERMGCGFGACLGCAVPARAGGYLHVCKDGPVFDSDMIDWEKL